MSLDVYLEVDPPLVEETRSPAELPTMEEWLRSGAPMREVTDQPGGYVVERIFVRRDGRNVEVSREEWDELYPGREPVVIREPVQFGQVFHANITHNLADMARECGLYESLWEPEKHGLERAGQLIEPVRRGLELLRSDRERFEAFNPANGWGDYDGLVAVAGDYLVACEIWPEASVRVWA